MGSFSCLSIFSAGSGQDLHGEPLPKDDLKGLAELARQAGIPIAGGELEWGFTVFETSSRVWVYDIVQPDPHWYAGDQRYLFEAAD